ncbi:CapA family protein [Streptomyces sp. NPDC006879]|uniref:CapA family protein n=1 Tax=Streptomyces sp. NPDC006879 TaxID=3364767 RepID=UPI0036D1E6F8
MTTRRPQTRPRRRSRPALTLMLLAGLLAAPAGCSSVAGSSGAHLAGPDAARSQPPAGPRRPEQPRGFTLVASGDVLPHESVIDRAQADAGGEGYDFGPMLAGVAPVVSSADLAICHMETVYGTPDGPFSGYPAFVSPPQIAEALAATGYDSCSTASNHSLDDGAAGLARTLDRLDRAGIAHAGTARTATEAATPTLLKAGGATVAHLAYTYGTNDHPMPQGQPWAVQVAEQRKILEHARAARKAGADVVVVSLHWGTEWQTTPDRTQLSLGRALTAARTRGRADIDLILGTHAHVPQPYEKVNGTWIIYGMGDQIAGRMFNHDGDFDPRGNYSSIGRFRFESPKSAGERWRVTQAQFLPQWMDGGSGRVVDLVRATEDHPGREDHRRAREVIEEAVLSRGADRDGLTSID